MVILLHFFSLRINYEIVLSGGFAICFHGFVALLKVIDPPELHRHRLLYKYRQDPSTRSQGSSLPQGKHRGRNTMLCDYTTV